jgi:phenylacetate-CoA ligase
MPMPMPSLRSSISLAPVAANLLLARRRERRPAAALRELQSRQLRALVRHAYEHVPYYRRVLTGAGVAAVRTAADLAELPVLDRRLVHELPEAELLAAGFTAENTRAARTSGSSGIPVTFRNSERDLGYLRATYLQDMLASGLRLNDRIGYFRTAAFLRHPLERFGVVRNLHINTAKGLDEQIETFLAARPTFLFGFPNVIATLVEELQRRGIDYPHAHTVVFGGERLTPAARANVLGYLGARGHEVYASVEMFTAARTCPLGALHLRTGNVVLEVEHDDGTVSVEDGEGEVLVTRLRSEAMPLIRYRIGDRVTIRPNDCPCGVAHTPIVTAIQGRSEDRLVAADGRSLHADYLTKVVERFPAVHRMQLLQRLPGTLEVRVLLTGGADGVPGPAEPDAADLVTRIRAAVVDALPSFEVEVRPVDRIVPEANGKIKLVKVVGPVSP